MVCRYDVELFQKVEALTGQKMEKFEAEQDAALVLLDGVNEAQRIATMQVTRFPSAMQNLCVERTELQGCALDTALVSPSGNLFVGRRKITAGLLCQASMRLPCRCVRLTRARGSGKATREATTQMMLETE